MSDDNSHWFLTAVRAVAISPMDAKALVARLRDQSERKHPNDRRESHEERVADHIISRFTAYSATCGGLTGLIGVIPGIGTAVAMSGGVAADVVWSMKCQLDMCMCLAETYGYDILEPDAQSLALLISAGGALETAGVKGGVKIASKAGVSLLRQYLKGATLQIIKQLFQKLGITLTRKALEKALPFGISVVVGFAGNYAMSRYVGSQARKWFILDRSTPRDSTEA